ncbi:MAG: hypothetical protein IT383_21695 [Deltaproteobacteria bacterium]|nr:hypothetical protein [Deltaproteobacteria bacterium]
MYLRLSHAIALGLVVGAVSVLSYRYLTAGTEGQVVVVAPPPLPPSPPLLPPPRPVTVVAPEPAYPDDDRLTDDIIDEMRECSQCDKELVNWRARPTLASKTALSVCIRHRCVSSNDVAVRRFESAVHDLRAGHTESACATLRALLADVDPSSAWAPKATTLHARRCAEAPRSQ